MSSTSATYAVKFYHLTQHEARINYTDVGYTNSPAEFINDNVAELFRKNITISCGTYLFNPEAILCIYVAPFGSRSTKGWTHVVEVEVDFHTVNARMKLLFNKSIEEVREYLKNLESDTVCLVSETHGLLTLKKHIRSYKVTEPPRSSLPD